MTDRIELLGLRGFGRHGVLAHEREQGQEFVVDVVLELDLRRAGRTDQLAATVDYGAVAESVLSRITGPAFDLIESLADRIAADVLAGSLVSPVESTAVEVTAVEVTVHKPGAPLSVPFTDVSVRIRRSRTRRAVIGLGANLGDRRAALQGAIYALATLGTLRALSPVFETPALTLPDSPPQPDYLNAVAVLEVALEPADLLAAAHEVEAAFGRVRTQRWGARTLDVDLICVDSLLLPGPGLTLPHPSAHQRAFVLGPWAEIEPAAELVGHGPVVDLLAALPEQERAGLRRRDDLALRLPCGVDR